LASRGDFEATTLEELEDAAEELGTALATGAA